MAPKIEEFRERVHRTVEEAIELIQSKKVTERKQGLEQIEQIFSSTDVIEHLDRPRDADSPPDGKVWLTILQALFLNIIEERRAYLQSKQPAKIESKLSFAAKSLRIFVSRVVRKINRRALKPLYAHLLQAIVDKGQLIEPLAHDYIAIFQVLLSHPSHVDHTPPETWKEIVILTLACVLGDPIPTPLEWSQNDIPQLFSTDGYQDELPLQAGSSRKRGRATSPESSKSIRTSVSARSQAPLSREQIASLTILGMLLRAPNAPLFKELLPDQDDMDPHETSKIILWKLLRCLRQRPADSIPPQGLVLGLSHLLTEIELNSQSVLTRFAAEATPDLLTAWRITPTSSLLTKEGLLICLRIVLQGLLLMEGTAAAGLPSELQKLCEGLEARSVLSHLLVKPLNIKFLRLCLLEDQAEPPVFACRTFQHGFDFDAQHAFTWGTLELHADSVLESLLRSSLHPRVAQPSDKKRLKVLPRDPLLDLFRVTHSNSEVQMYNLQLMLFVIERHWLRLPESLRASIMQELVTVLHHEDPSVVSFGFLCFGAIAARLPSTEEGSETRRMETSDFDWVTVWDLASRKGGDANVCRAAYHILRILLPSSLMDSSRKAKELERIISDIAIQGPAALYDSVCSFLSEALHFANASVRVRQLGLDEKVFTWLNDTWTSQTSEFVSFPSIMARDSKSKQKEIPTSLDLLHLLETMCNLHSRRTRRAAHLLPSSQLVSWYSERRRTGTIRQYFFECKLQSSIHSTRGMTAAEHVDHSQEQRLDSSLPASTQQGMPSNMASKCSKLLLKLIEQLSVPWNSPPDLRQVRPSQMRFGLDTIVVTFLFETCLNLNGTRMNLKALRKGYELMITLLELTTQRGWREVDKAFILASLDPLTSASRPQSEDLQVLALVDPQESSGLQDELIRALKFKKTLLDMQLRQEDREGPLLWRELQKSVDLSTLVRVAREVLLTLEQDAQTHPADSIAEDDDFDGRTSTEADAASFEERRQRFRTCYPSVFSCGHLLLAPAHFLSSSTGNSDESRAAMMNYFFTPGQELRATYLGGVFCQCIRTGNLVLTSSDMALITEWFEKLLKSYDYSANEALQLFLLDWLDATMSIWVHYGISDEPMDLETQAGSDVNALCLWLVGVGLGQKVASWRVRERLASFLEDYIISDPDQRFLRQARDEPSNPLDSISERAMEIDSQELASLSGDRPRRSSRINFPGMRYLAQKTQDSDSRVRFRVAVANAQVVNAVCKDNICSPQDVYDNVFTYFCKVIERFEHMLTRFISLGNFMIVNGVSRRVPYWHLIEIALHVETYLPHVEVVLDGVSEHMGLQDRSLLFKAFSSNMAYAIHQIKGEFMMLSPSVLGFRNRTDMIIGAFPRICPIYLWKESSDPQEVLKQRFFQEYVEKAGSTPAAAIITVLPEVLSLILAFFIDDKTQNGQPMLSHEDEAILDLSLQRITSLCGIPSASVFLRKCWDRVTFRLLALLSDMDCSAGGPLCIALEEVEDPDATSTFICLTQHRSPNDFVSHTPNPPSVSAITVAKALKRLHGYVAQSANENSSGRVTQTGMVCHVLYSLQAAISLSPLVNEQFRLLNALCFHIARNHRKFRDYTLLRIVTRGATLLLKQRDLFNGARSILEWAITKYVLINSEMAGLSDIITSIGQTASDYLSQDDVISQRLGTRLLDWIEGWMSQTVSGATTKDGIATHIGVALTAWPRPFELADINSGDRLGANLITALEDPGLSAGRFCLIRKLRDVSIAAASEEFGPMEDFWTLKSCIPEVEYLAVEDAEAFGDLLLLAGGQLQTVSDEPMSTNTLAMRHSLKTTPFPPVREYLVLSLHSMLWSDSSYLVDLAYRTLRSCFAAGFAAKLVREALAMHIHPELTLLSSFPVEPLKPPFRSLEDLLTLDLVSGSGNFSGWLRETTRLFSGVLAQRDAFFGQIQEALTQSTSFAEEAFPLLLRAMLERAPVDSPESPRLLISRYFTRVLEFDHVDNRCRRSIIHAVLHLRHFPLPGVSKPLAYTNWLNLDYSLLARAATACGSYTTALLFLELALETVPEDRRDLHDAKVEDLLYTIYAHIEEPDGFYGIKARDMAKFLIKRFDHESQWERSFQYHGSTYDLARGSASFLPLAKSLHSLGFNSLGMQIFNALPTAECLQDPAGIAYQLAWRTESWDLPPPNPEQPGATLYLALRSVSQDNDNGVVKANLDYLLRREMYHLRETGNEDMVAIKGRVANILCLGELRQQLKIHLSGLDKQIASTVGLQRLEFQDFENVVAARISFIRSRRFQSERDHIGDMSSTPSAQAEFASLLEIARMARINGRVEFSMNAIHRARSFAIDPATKFRLEREYASMLWAQGERPIAIKHLEDLRAQVSTDAETFGQIPGVLSQLGEWLSLAAMEKPLTIQEKYFNQALDVLRKNPSENRLLKVDVVHRFATFCEKQYLAHVRSPDAAFLKNTCEDLQIEVEELENAMTTHSRNGDDWKHYHRQLKKTREEHQRYSEKYQAHIQASDVFLQAAIQHYATTITEADPKDEVDIVIRICALWFNNFRDDQLADNVRSYLLGIPTHKLIFISHQLSSRLSTDDRSKSQQILQRLVFNLSVRHLFHTFYQLFALEHGSDDGRSSIANSSLRHSQRGQPQQDVPHEPREMQARILLGKLRANTKITERVENLTRVCEAYLQWAKLRLDKDAVQPEMTMPRGLMIAQLRDVNVPIATDYLTPDPRGKYDNFVSLQSYESRYRTAGGINLPKITQCRGSDGELRTQLFKGQGDDDLRQDAVMEQVFELVNYLLSKDPQTRRRRLCVRTYKVLPLAPQAGVLEFVPHTKPMKAWLDEAHPLYRPSDIRDSKAAGIMASARKKGDDLLRAYRSVCNNFKPVMRHFFAEASKLPMAWFLMRLNYARSVATTSIVGHMIGLGDRHTSNILLQEQTGEVVHIDLGIAFDQGRQLGIPELVPFRLTRDMVDGLGSTGVDGVFRRCAEETLRVLRDDSDVIMTVLGVFKTDPLYSWTVHPLKLRRKQQEAMASRLMGDTVTTTTTDTGIHGDEDDRLLAPDTVDKLAERALASVARKLDKNLSVAHDVQELISQATDESNLANIYFGWRPWL